MSGVTLSSFAASWVVSGKLVYLVVFRRVMGRIISCHMVNIKVVNHANGSRANPLGMSGNKGGWPGIPGYIQ